MSRILFSLYHYCVGWKYSESITISKHNITISKHNRNYFWMFANLANLEATKISCVLYCIPLLF